uniref:Uncharacterized protein n=1 Tax=Acrobeloides nanus TaxID=290746 RepID=A0A914DFN5_9BILA
MRVENNKQYEMVMNMKKTWLKRTDSYEFFDARKNGRSLPSWLMQPFSHENSRKDNFIIKQALSKLISLPFYNHKWYILASEGTFLIIENVRHVLKNLQTHLPIYIVIGERQNLTTTTYILNEKALAVLSQIKYQKSTVCSNDNFFHLTQCLEENGVIKYDISYDSENRKRFFTNERHFSFTEMQDYLKTRNSYWDDAEIFESLSPEMLAFYNLRDIEILMFDVFLYRITI